MNDLALPKKSLGQHWLHDADVLEAMCQAADVGQGDVVLEIGPGTGTLTAKLLEHQAKVIAIEFDVSLIPGLQKRFSSLLGTSFDVEPGDIRTYDFGNLAGDYKIVANIPYYLTAYLLRRLTEGQTHKPNIAALLVQREVAERVATEPGDMSVMAVAAEFYYEVTLGQVVPAALFTPPPKVDSQILILQQRPKPLFDVDARQFMRLVKAGFAQRRKTLANNLSGGLQIDRARVAEIIKLACPTPSVRAQALSLGEWHELYQHLTPLLHQ